MTEEEEFGDEIDWSTVRLPSISALSAVRSNGISDDIAMTTSSGGTGLSSLRHSSVDPPRNCAVAGGENRFKMSTGSMVQAPDNHVALANANPNAEVLRRQIQDLQSQLQTKDDLIFELEATAAASAAEATHRACKAEDDARKRVHLAEEELRRVRMEAEKYKGSLMRQKRRVAELEASRRKLGDSGRGRDRAKYHQQMRSNYANWDDALPLDVELRKVTPSISDKKVVAADDDDCESSKKRKAGKFSDANSRSADAMTYLHQHVTGVGRWDPASGGSSARQRLVKHLLNRDEMGSYYFDGGGGASDASQFLMVDSAMFLPKEAHVGKTRLLQPKQDSFNLTAEAMLQEIFFERETQKLVKSILYQMTEAPDNHHLSISGFVHILMVKFNSLFQYIESKVSNDQSGDGDHVMGQEDDRSDCMFASQQTGVDHQKFALILPSSTVLSEDKSSPSEFMKYGTTSWRAVLYLISILHDTILMSKNARDDLRWWCYQSCQLSVAGDLSNTNSPCAAEGAMGRRAEIVNGVFSHMRIEGLPTGGPLHISSCHQNSKKPTENWDPVSMGQPCKMFFELVVALMKGNVSEHFKSRTSKEDISTGWEYTVLFFVQLKAIDLVFAIMSDAPPYDHAGDSHGNRTPYLWKFWFESLFPLYSTNQTAAKFKRHWDTTSAGDFFSLWEKSDEKCDHLLGSGRKYMTRLLSGNLHNIISQRNQGAEKHGRQMNSGHHICCDNRKQQEQLSVIIRARILDLISHFMLCSSSVCQGMQQTFGKSRTSLSKRIIAAVLDDIEEYMLPFLSSCPYSDYHVHDVEICLQLCFSCVQILLSMLRLNDGTQMMRLQMRLESQEGEPSRWSQSAIGCVTSLLDILLSFPARIEERGDAVYKSGHITHALNTVVDQCVIFFKTIMMSVYQQRKSSKAATFSALISEHKTIFTSCCQRILAHRSLLHFGDALKYDVRDFIEEMMIDEREERNDVNK